MPNAPGAGQEEEQYDWVHIDDFSPGVYDGSHISTESPVVSAPIGAANSVGTFSCASIPGGALAPLPALTTQVTYSYGYPGTATQLLLSGFVIIPQLSGAAFEIVSVTEADDGTNHYVQAVSNTPSLATVSAITGPSITSATTNTPFFGSPYPTFTRMSTSGNAPWPPVLVFPTSAHTDPSGSNGHLWVYPSLAAPTTFVADDLITSGSSVTGQTITYGERVLALAGVEYPHPVGSSVATNENINFTDPPLSNVYGDQESILGAEDPWGYGAWGTVSVGELLLIKKYGGAVVLYGDIFAPTSVVPVPGVESTGNFVGSAAATPTGLYYCSQKRGAWMWNGGSTSTKISKNLADDFYDMPGVGPTFNYGFFAYHWGKWVMFSKNFMYDTESGAWWVLYPNENVSSGAVDGHDFFWYTIAEDGNQLVTAPLVISTANGNIFYNIFDNTVPSNFYQWSSLPIHVTKHADRVLDIRKVMVRASSPGGGGTPLVTVTINGTGIGTSSGVSIGPDPTIISLNCGVKGVQDILVTLLCNNTGSNPAPIIHSVDIGYEIRVEVKPNN